ncbi:MAG: DUF938 domain-containing protein [Cyanobacteria bacterium P01_A01_bin.45]
MNTPPDARQYSPATLNNRKPILEILEKVLPPQGTVLEIASGTGEHAVYFAPQLRPRKWIPSDPNPNAIASIAGWQKFSPSENLYPPIELNVYSEIWSVEYNATSKWKYIDDLQDNPITAIVNINMIHISPWEMCLGLMAGAKRILPNEGILYMYGPYKRNGKHTAPSNEVFDSSLRSRNPQWGVRDLDDVIAVASKNNLELVQVYEMPANNLSVVFKLNQIG